MLSFIQKASRYFNKTSIILKLPLTTPSAILPPILSAERTTCLPIVSFAKRFHPSTIFKMSSANCSDN